MTDTFGLSVQPHLANRFTAVARQLGYGASTPEAHRAWRRRILRQIRRVTGYDTLERTDLSPRVNGVEDCGDHFREHVRIETEPDVAMTLYVLRPKGETRRRPAVIAPHGHGSGGKVSVAGDARDPRVAEAIQQYNYDYGVQFAREGFTVFCPDARGFGERQEAQSRHDVLASSCLWINNMAVPLGQTVTGMWAWDLHRLVDYIATRPDCQPDRIGCAGLSGGGLQTLWAAALDTRIRCAVISGYFYGYRESLFIQHANCACNYVPGLYAIADMGDLAALIAPRPLLIETGDQDWLNGPSGLDNVLPQVAITRQAYTCLGAPDRLSHHIFHGGHRWNGEQAIPWMKRWLMSEEA